MFILQDEPRWTWPVPCRFPVDGGGFEEKSFKAVFRFVPEGRRQELGATEEGVRSILREAVVEVQDVLDGAEKPIPHSPELLEAMLANPWIRQGLMQSYADALGGGMISRAALGN